jgi:NhaC family Na+:H+ antiporter
LAVNPLDYIFYTFFNLINPVLAIIYAYLGIKILRIPIPVIESEQEQEQEPITTKA